ncbi:MAG: SDR family oxidoreductase [Phaeodactylibacter sp.]|nr:SDR family oxidoreductase [Phaeodactylibacter sp.]
MNLTGKTALITGASSGIGEAFAYLLASKGMNLVIVARSKAKLETIAQEIRDKYQVTVEVLQQDLGIAHSAKALYDTVKSRQIGIDLLINNAGFGKWGRFEAFAAEEYEQMIQLNVTSLTELCYFFLEDLKQRDEAGIINVGSTASFMPVPFSGVYGGTKSYVLSFTEALVGELESTNITVHCLCPSGTESNFNAVANSNNKTDHSTEKLMSSAEVAQIGLDAFLAKKHYVVTGRKTQITIMKFLSRRRVIQMIADFWEKRLGL